jgi:hypothetical protein
MPWPTRIIQNCPRDSDKVSVAGRQNTFGLLKLCDQTDSDDRNVDGLLDGTSERYLIVRPESDLLM